MSDRVVDARGLSCPQPVILTLNEIKKNGNGEVTVLVDTDTSVENVSRAAQAQGWNVNNIQSDGDNFTLTLKKD